MILAALQHPILRAASRLFLSESVEYAAYFSRMQGRRSVLVDVSGTGRSPSHFISSINGALHTSLLLIAGTPTVANWVNDLAPTAGNVSVDFLTEQTHATRLMLEALNMSLEDRPVRVTFDGSEFSTQYSPNEFGEEARIRLRVMRETFMSFVNNLEKSEIKVPVNCPPF